MTVPSEPQKAGFGLLLIVALGIVFVLFARLGMLTLPLAALILFARPMPRRFRLTAVLATGVSLGWLAGNGDLADQVVRAAVVIATAAFTITVVFSRWSLVHRSLVAILVATAGVGGLMTVFGTSWPEVRWWVETKINFSAQITLSWLATTDASGSSMVVQVEDWFQNAIPLMADFFPATTALQMLAGFALATVVYQRMMYPKGQTLGRVGGD